MILFIDTETTGLPQGYASLEEQPFLVQIAAVLFDDNRKPVASVSRLIQPDGWIIPMEATAIHGYTTGHCRRYGVPLSLAFRELLSLWSQAQRVVAYNVRFDQKIVEFSAQRLEATLPVRELYCAMIESAKLISGGRWLKLEAAYQCFFGVDFENKHDAIADMQACISIYFALQDTLAPVSRLVGDVRALGSARLQRALSGAREVDEHQEIINSLMGMHRTPFKPVNWTRIFAEEIPDAPSYLNTEERIADDRLKAYRPNLLMRLLEFDQDRIRALEAEVERSRNRDRNNYDQVLAIHKNSADVIQKKRHFARRILSGDQAAYLELMELNEIAASPMIARSVIYSFVNSTSVEVFAYLNGPEFIPDETKSLLKTGRVSIKRTKKKEFVSIYQDHLCSAVLRMARDFIALLPVKTIVIHGYIPDLDSANGQQKERCVLSCALSRTAMNQIDFNQIDPSDCVSSFPHSMKISKSELQEIEPVTIPKD